MMKVGFDISQTAFQGGVGVYTSSLAAELIKIKDLEMVYFYSSLRKGYAGNLPDVKKYPFPPCLTEIMFNKLRVLPIEAFIGRIDVFHSSDWTQPKSIAKKVTTYHDVIPLKFPQWSHPKIVAVHKKRLELVEKEVDMVIAVSSTTKKDLLEVSRIPKEKIMVVYEAAGEHFKPQERELVEGFKKKLKLPEKFILAIGGIGKRRNLDRVKEVSKDYPLIITKQNIPEVSDKEMPLLYSAASVLLYPSFYEGFGLPILEAMACGTPVITSNVSSMPEIGGAAALYVNPMNTTDMSTKLKNVMEDNNLRENLIKRGFVNIKRFSWKKTAEETAEVYKILCQT